MPEPADSEPVPDASAATEEKAHTSTPAADDAAAPSASASSSDEATEPVPEPAEPEVAPAPPIADGEPLATPAGSVSLSAGELAGAAGVDLTFVDDLERLGLIEAVGSDGTTSFDHEALVVTKAAAAFTSRGLEPRHLRMFKVAAEREAGLFEQLTAPRVRKGGESRIRARAELNELARLGETIHRSILRRSLGSSLD